MHWLYISLFSYFLSSISYVISKIILSDFGVVKPAAYAFFSSILGIGVFLLMFFHFSFPAWNVTLAALFSGIIYTFALLIFYSLLNQEDTSQVVPFVGGITPIFTVIFAYFLLGEMLKINQIFGFLFIVCGGFLAAFDYSIFKHKIFIQKNIIVRSIIAACFFGLSQVFVKYVFNHINFWDGFIWRGLGAVAGALILFFIPIFRREIIFSFKSSTPKIGISFILAQIISFFSFISLNYAYFLGLVSLVNALSGIQYVFLFLFIVLLSKFYPQILKEDLRVKALGQKIISILLISGGLFILFV